MIEISVLGEFEATYEGSAIPLQPMQNLVVLALLCAGGLINRDRLAELIWRNPTPASLNTLRTHLLRIDRGVKAVGGDPEKFIVRVPLGARRRGYRLAEALDIDAIRFERLVADGCDALRHDRFEEADRILARALLLRKRGEPFPEAADRSFAIGFAGRLEDAYKNGVISYFKTGIALGRHREVAGELPAFAHRWPGERELQTLHVHVLYRSNREEEAVAVCRQAIDAARAAGIDDRLWLDLQRDVLRGDLSRSGALTSSAPAAA